MFELTVEHEAVSQEPPKAKINRGGINPRHHEAVEKATLVLAAARNEVYGVILENRDIDSEFIHRFEAELNICKERLARAVEVTADIQVATETAGLAQKQLLAALKEIQAAARQKYFETEPARLMDYFLGEKLGPGRASILRISGAILEQLESDQLPGIEVAKVTTLRTLRDFYLGATITQADLQCEAVTVRDAIHSDVAAITAQRVKIQFAAEVQWPPTYKGNASIRREFQLPPDRSFHC